MKGGKIKDIVKKYTFSADEREKLRDLQAAIVVSMQQVDGMQIYKNVILEQVYKRLGIDGDPQKGYSKNIQYNLGVGEITYTESLVKEEKKPIAKK